MGLRLFGLRSSTTIRCGTGTPIWIGTGPSGNECPGRWSNSLRVSNGNRTPRTALLPASESWAFYHTGPFDEALGYGSLRGSTLACIGDADPSRTRSRGGSRGRGWPAWLAAEGDRQPPRLSGQPPGRATRGQCPNRMRRSAPERPIAFLGALREGNLPRDTKRSHLKLGCLDAEVHLMPKK